ncbi:MAG TPA: hypothetical protein VI454_11010 [Verrucomicrobiae bacterium]|jgi:hypothetical protein
MDFGIAPSLVLLVPFDIHFARERKPVEITTPAFETVARIRYESRLLTLAPVVADGAKPEFLVPRLNSRIPETFHYSPRSYEVEDDGFNTVAHGRLMEDRILRYFTLRYFWKLEDNLGTQMGLLRPRVSDFLGFRVVDETGGTKRILKRLPRKQVPKLSPSVQPYVLEEAETDFCTWIALMVWLTDLVYQETDRGS